MPQRLTKLFIHIVFTTQNRQPFLGKEIQEALYPIISRIISRRGGKLIRIGGTEDHVHLLISLRPDQSLSTLVQAVKANSSRWLKAKAFTNEQFAWQRGYGAFSVSPQDVEKLIRYIDRQEEHHRGIADASAGGSR